MVSFLSDPASASADPRRRWINPEHLNVSPTLLGAPLALPRQRLLAIALDLVLVWVISDVGNIWLVSGAGLAMLLWLRTPLTNTASRRLLGLLAAASLLGFGAWQFAITPHVLPSHGHLKAGDDDDNEVAKMVPGLDAAQTQKLRIATLEAELAQAREPKGFDPKQRVQDWLDDVGLGLSWAIAYFTLLPVWWNGQTLGKKLMRIRVVELTGKPLTVLRAFGRYGGYAAGAATGGFGFAQIWWDPNRQCIQDKTAHTVVVDLRRTLRPPPIATGDDDASPVS